MGLLTGMIGLVILGLGVIVFLFLKDKDSIEASIERLDPEQITGSMLQETENTAFVHGAAPKKKKSSGLLGGLKLGTKKNAQKTHEQKPSSGGGPLSGILNKVKFGKKPSLDEEIPQATPFPDLEMRFEREKPSKPTENNKSSAQETTGTASLKIKPIEPLHTDKKPTLPEKTDEFSPGEPLSAEEEKQLNQEIESSINETSLKEKYDRLDRLFKEKNSELERLKTAFENEQKNRKDFNKVKDILEKEIKDAKEQAKEAEAQLNSSRTEIESYKKRVNQLEDKATKLEKEIIAREQEIEELKRKSSPPAPVPQAPNTIKNTDPPAEKIEKVDVEPAEPPSLPKIELVDPSKMEKKEELIEPSEPPSLPKVQFIDPHEPGTIPSMPHKNTDPTLSENKQRSIAEEIEDSIKMNEPPLVSDEPAEPDPTGTEQIQEGLSESEKMSELEKKIKEAEGENPSNPGENTEEKKE